MAVAHRLDGIISPVTKKNAGECAAITIGRILC